MNNPKELYKDLEPLLNCIDYTVSKESYEVMYNQTYDLLVTSPVPSNLDKYYQSELYISHTDSKKTLFDKIYQLVKNYSLKKKLKLINSFNTQEKDILDIGAGTGDFLKTCVNDNWNITGVEPSKKARTIALEKDINLEEKLTDIENKKFDVITLWHVLEHVPNLFEYIEVLKELLKPNGKLIIAVPNYKSYDAIYYKEHWAAFDVPRHLWHFSKKSIQKIFSQYGFQLENILPMKFDSYYVSLLSEKYKTGKSNPIKAFYLGFKSNLKAKKTKEYSSHIYILKK
ncbi:class I SAM-dependent methyltransferase [Tenacibaculum sp. 190130A14a]|uniref:class I SAM-dependent methyltransferase n=1 Tax=Tenacibaculum polynesiense TaxID=3137857 RepID=UPI0032B246CB